MGYTVKKVAEKTKLSPNALRYYEKEGLLPNVGRTKGGIRLYSDEDLEWIASICCLKNTGQGFWPFSHMFHGGWENPRCHWDIRRNAWVMTGA